MKTIEIDLELNRLIENARQSFKQSESDILKILLREAMPANLQTPQIELDKSRRSTTESAIPIGSRKTGDWSTRYNGKIYIGRNLREAYVTAISVLTDDHPEVLGKLSKDGSGRRRTVARSAEELFPNSPHLARHQQNWHKLGDWYVDLNLSAAQASKRIRLACSLAGVTYGQDLEIRDGLKQL